MNGWLSVEEAARICGTDVQRITLWMNGNHIACLLYTSDAADE